MWDPVVFIRVPEALLGNEEGCCVQEAWTQIICICPRTPRSRGHPLSTLQWWKWANLPAQTLLFTVPGNRHFAMEKFLTVPIGTGHKLHNTKGVFLRLLADLCTRCASRPRPCAISEESFHFFSGVMSKGGLSSSTLLWSRVLEVFLCYAAPFSLRSTSTFISTILFLP